MDRRTLFKFSSARCCLTAVAVCMAAGGCSPPSLKLAPPAPDQPSAFNDSAPDRRPDFRIRSDPALGEIASNATIDTKRVYGLAGLIDIAQRNNPSTYIAWERARQAALAVGVAESTLLPHLAANAVAGQQRVATTLPMPFDHVRSLDVTLKGETAALALQWLIFDFGQRAALVDAAKQGSAAANVIFDGAHQKLIFDVARAYYQYGAAVEGQRIAQQAVRNSNAIRDAVEQQRANNRATTVDVAQARQQVVQAELRRVRAEGIVRDSYQTLLSAMGVTATLRIKIGEIGRRRLPPTLDAPAEAMIRQALSQRPDIAASYAAFKASKSAIAAAEAEFLPKVFVAGGLATGTNGFNVNGLPTINTQATGIGVLFGATVPLFDAGLRSAQLTKAQSQASAAEQSFKKTQMDAVTEIVAASNALRTALESFHAASNLVRTAAITHDAAVAAYQNGVGTVTAATDADTGLLNARLAQADTHAASLIAAANLAFVMGALTSSERVPR